MDATTATAKRIHPLMAAAAASVIIASAAATAAITGLLPNSHSAPEPQANTAAAQQLAAQGVNLPTPAAVQPGATAQPYGQSFAQQNAQQNAQQYALPNGQPYAQQYVPAAAAAPAPAPLTAMNAEPAPAAAQAAPAVHKRPVVHHRSTQVARYDDAGYQQRPAPAPRQPNYVAMGTGAVIGGLLGNQVGSGNGRKLATVAGIIGGGMLGNEIANRQP